MAKILDTTSFNGSVQKIVELANGYIINGQYYSKNNLSPKALKFFKTYGNTQDLSLNKKLILKSNLNPTYKNDTKTVVVDNYDNSIVYVFSTGTRGNYLNLFKFKETEDNVQLILDANYSSNPNVGAFPQAYAGQDQYYLYYIMQTNYTGGSGYFVRINKKTLVLENILSFSTYNSGGGVVLKETDNYIFFGFQRYYGDIALYRYSKLTNTVESLGVPNRRGKGYFGANMSNLIETGPSTGYAFAVLQDATTGAMYINKYNFDFSQTAANSVVTSESTQTITWTGFSNLPTLNAAVSSMYDCFVVDANDGKKILVVALYETSANSTANDAQYHGFYTFEINPSDELIALNFTSISTTSLKGFLASENKKVLVTATDSAVYFLNFDESAKKYVIADKIDTLPVHIGMDQSENIWFVNNLEEVEMVSLTVPTIVDIRFEKQSYKYEGLDIPTYIEIEAKNYQGNRVGVQLELSIRGEAVFESNSQKVIQEITDVNGPKRVNIIIKGSGAISIYPKLIV